MEYVFQKERMQSPKMWDYCSAQGIFFSIPLSHYEEIIEIRDTSKGVTVITTRRVWAVDLVTGNCKEVK